MSPAQAAQVAGVSRWTVMRAINAQELQANRGNRNQWKIAPDALDRWRASTVRTPADLHTLHTPDAVELAILKAENGHLRERLAATEADRDRWQSMAEKLVERPRRSWWPWGRS
jgi:excisionase family DNA binding protein